MGDTVIRILIVDDIPESREGITKLLAFEADIEVIGEASTGTEGLEKAMALAPDIILMDINMPDMDGITATQEIARRLPAAAVIIISVHKEPSYLRRAMLAGAQDFLEKPIAGDELYETVRRVYELHEPTRQQYTSAALSHSRTQQDSQKTSADSHDGKIIAVYSPQGGAGKTTLAINLATALVYANARVLLIDCDLQFGDIEGMLYLQTTYTLADFVRSTEAPATDLIERRLANHASGLKILPAPTELEETEAIHSDVMRRTIETLASHFDYIILDMRVFIDDLALSLFDIADRILLIGTPTLPTIRRCRRILDIFEHLAYTPEKTLFVLNRASASHDQAEVDAETIEKHIRHPIEVKIPSDEKTFLSSINRGEPVVTQDRNRSPARELWELADSVRQSLYDMDTALAPDSPNDGGRLRRFLGKQP